MAQFNTFYVPMNDDGQECGRNNNIDFRLCCSAVPQNNPRGPRRRPVRSASSDAERSAARLFNNDPEAAFPPSIRLNDTTSP